MTAPAAVTIVALVVAAALLIRTALVWIDIGADLGGVGPWRRPRPERGRTRLPADFIGLWSLFGSRSIETYDGSWEAAVRRLDRLEESLTGRPRSTDGTVERSSAWLARRVGELEAVVGISPPGGFDDPADGRRDRDEDPRFR